MLLKAFQVFDLVTLDEESEYARWSLLFAVIPLGTTLETVTKITFSAISTQLQ